MSGRNLALAERAEGIREKQPTVAIVTFDLSQIKSHFDQSILAIESQFQLVESLLAQGTIDASKDILRSQVVFAESSLDFYLHEISKYGVLQIFSGKWPSTPKYTNIRVPMRVFAEGIQNPETDSWFKKFINDQFSREVYLSLESMQDQLRLLGISPEEVFETAFPKPSDTESDYMTGKQIVRELFNRRNQIAHQCDRSHADAQQNDITKEYVQRYISWIKKLVETIQLKAIEKSSNI